ncbi:site-specific integrase [Dysosmobacter welbionis]|uniref:tyrosine-type recombinase/integrase n=1 Tax=Dysosmobacter welbionis TaxID=2093857 RepID=UPI0029421740|nr:site-specific integrase [Dysosmobacter welbionis]
MSNRKKRGDGSIRKRSDGRWEGRYTAGRNEETGKLIYKSVLAKTQAECKRQLREALRHQEQQADMQPAQLPEAENTTQCQKDSQAFTVARWLRTWYDLYAKQNIRRSTQLQYTYFMRDLVIPRISELPLSQLSGLRLQMLYQELRTSGRTHPQRHAGQGLSPKTVRSVHLFLHAALEQAVRAGVIAKNPTVECKPPKLERKEMKVIQPEQIGNYLQAAAERNVLPMFFLELTTGLRRGELLALLWSDLDPQNRSISVTKSVSRLNGELVVSQPKTQHSIRTLLIPQQAVDLLVQEHSQHPNNPYLFPSPTTGTMYSPETVARIHKRILRDAGLEDCRFHDLRHTFATVALQNGVDIKTLSGMLGHYSSDFTLDTYTHVTRKMQEEAAEKMGQFMEMKL